MDLETANRLFSYNPETGLLTRKVKAGKMKAGSEAGHTNNKGHLRVSLGKKSYYVHRVCWLLFYQTEPPEFIDHVNGNGEDNRISNLRATTKKQNSANMKITKRNTSGVKGVSWHKLTSKWRATMLVDGKHTTIGYFDDVHSAELAMKDFRLKQHKEFARHE